MRIGFTLYFLLLMSLGAFAQEEDLEDVGIDSLDYNETYEESGEDELVRGFMGDVHLTFGIPSGAFKESLGDDIAFGFGIRALFDTKKMGSPVWLGAEFDLMSYGSNTTRVEVQNGNFLDIYDLEISNSIASFNGILRYIPQWNSAVLPYFDGIIGFKVLVTSSQLFEDDFGGSVEIESDTNEIDWAFQYGTGFGLLIRRNWLGRIRTYIDINIQYLRGASADYLVRTGNLDAFEDPIDAFEKKTSTTDLFMPKIGLLLEIQ